MQRWPLVGALAALVVSIAGFAVIYLRGANGLPLYALDDAYIGFATARNLAQHGVWGVTRFEFSGAATSLLWPLLLAALERAIGFHTLTAFLLNVAITAGVLVSAHRIMTESVHDAGWQAAALIAIVVSVPLAMIPFIGMEHGLQCLLVLVAASAGTRAAVTPPGPRRVRLVATTAVAAALGVATRYDTASVVAGLVVVLAATIGWHAALAVAAAAVAATLPYAFVAHRHGWPMVPIAIVQKSRVFDLPFSASGVLSMAKETARVAVHAPSVTALIAAAAVLLVFMRPGRDTVERRAWLVTFLIAALLHLQFGRIEWPHRYEMYLLALGIVAVARALPGGAWRLPAPRPAVLAVATLVMLLPLASRAVDVHRDIADAVRFFYAHEYQHGMFLRAHKPEGAVMVVDLGGPAFYSDARIVDLGGLGSLDVVQRLAGGQPLTADIMRDVAAADHVTVGMDLDELPVPREWTPIGDWKSRYGNTSFFAVDPADADGLRRSLQQYATVLPSNVELRLSGEQHGPGTR